MNLRLFIVALFFILSPAVVLANEEAQPLIEEETPISAEEPGGIPNVRFCMYSSDGMGDRPEQMTAADFENAEYGTVDYDGTITWWRLDIGYDLPCKEAPVETPVVEPTALPTEESVEPTVPPVTEVPVTEEPIEPTFEPTAIPAESTSVPATEVPVTEAPVTQEPAEPVASEPSQASVTEVPVIEELTVVVPTEMSDGTEGSVPAEEPVASTQLSAMMAAGEQVARSAVAAAVAVVGVA